MMRVTTRPFNIGRKRLYFGLCEDRSYTDSGQPTPHECSDRVRLDKTQSEEKESALPPIADTRADIDLRRFGPRLCENSTSAAMILK